VDITELAKLSPQVLAIGASIYLFREMRAALSGVIAVQTEWRKSIEALLDRYHTLVQTHTTTLRDLTEALKDEHQND
jgi:hypothetical protein